MTTTTNSNRPELSRRQPVSINNNDPEHVKLIAQVYGYKPPQQFVNKFRRLKIEQAIKKNQELHEREKEKEKPEKSIEMEPDSNSDIEGEKQKETNVVDEEKHEICIEEDKELEKEPEIKICNEQTPHEFDSFKNQPNTTVEDIKSWTQMFGEFVDNEKRRFQRFVCNMSVGAFDIGSRLFFAMATPLVKRLPDDLFGVEIISVDTKFKPTPLMTVTPVDQNQELDQTNPLRPLINIDKIQEDEIYEFTYDIKYDEEPHLRYAYKVLKHKMSHFGITHFNNVFRDGVQYLTANVKVKKPQPKTQIVRIHAKTFSEAYITILSTLHRLYNSFRMRLNYKYTAGERSYWFCRYFMGTVVSFLMSKERLQINQNNVHAIAAMIFLKFLEQNKHAKPIINILISLDNEYFTLVNEVFMDLLTIELTKQNTFREIADTLFYRCMLNLIICRYHFQNPVGVIVNGEELLFPQYH